MKTDMKRWAADIISQKRVAAVPVMTHPGIELTGHTVRQAVSDGRVHAEAVVRLSCLPAFKDLIAKVQADEVRVR